MENKFYSAVFGGLACLSVIGVAGCGGSDDDDNGSGPQAIEPIEITVDDNSTDLVVSLFNDQNETTRLAQVEAQANTVFTGDDGNDYAISTELPLVTKMSYSSNDFEGIEPEQEVEYEEAENLIFAIGDSVTILGAAVIDMRIGDVNVTNIDPPLTITIRVDSAIPDGTEVVVGSYRTGDTVIRPEGTAEVQNGEVVFTMNHLTTAAVVGGAVVAGAVIVEDNNDDSGSGGEGESE
jgi:hypothetical protein